jgi:hypothetical protein
MVGAGAFGNASHYGSGSVSATIFLRSLRAFLFSPYWIKKLIQTDWGQIILAVFDYNTVFSSLLCSVSVSWRRYLLLNGHR